MTDELYKLLLDEVKELKRDVKSQSETLHSINLTLAVQAEQLTLHIKRTELAESALSLLSTEINNRVTPIEKHVNGISFMLKFAGAVSLIVTVILGLTRLYHQVQ